MPGPPAQHRGTVYGDDENAPKPGLGPPVRRRPQHAHRRASRSHPPQGLGTALRTPDRRNGVRVWGAVHVCSRWLLGVLQVVAHVSCPSGSSRAPAYAGPRSRPRTPRIRHYLLGARCPCPLGFHPPAAIAKNCGRGEVERCAQPARATLRPGPKHEHVCHPPCRATARSHPADHRAAGGWRCPPPPLPLSVVLGHPQLSPDPAPTPLRPGTL